MSQFIEMYKYLFAVSFLFSLQIAYGIDLTKENLNHQVNPFADLHFVHQVVAQGKEYIIQYRIITGPGKKLEDFSLAFYTQPKYTTQNHRDITQSVPLEQINSANGGYYIKAAIPSQLVDTLLIAAITDVAEQRIYYFDIPMLLPEDYPASDISIDTNRGKLLDDFTSTSTPLKFSAPAQKVYGYYYKYSFPPATAPMTMERVSPKSAFKIDSTFSFSTSDTIMLSREGLYLFQTDTSSAIAKPLLVNAHSFPKYTNLEKLMESTRYLTTSTEFRNLMYKKNKDAFDELWLTMTGSVDRARTAIRLYYQRIEEANRYFTSYKEGWKTDMGMIYTIFGTPDELTKGQDYQMWKYYGNDERAEITFTFVKIKDIFSRSHFDLVRNSKHGNAWLKSVEKWRKGR